MTKNSTLVELVRDPSLEGESRPLDQGPWKVLIVNSDHIARQRFHSILNPILFHGWPMQLIEAESDAEALHLLIEHPDIAMALIEVRLNGEGHGLGLIKFIRNSLQNESMQIILHTADPDSLCVNEVMLDYEINDFHSTAELTNDRLAIMVTASLRAFALTRQLKKAKNAVEQEVHQRTEELLESKEAAEYSLRQRSDMLAHITHDLRSPLSSILGLSNLLTISGEYTEQEDICNAIKNSCEHVLELVNNVLDFSKIESGEFTITTTRFDLHETLDSIKQAMTPLASDKGLVFTLTYSNHVPRIIQGDPVRLQQILQNLISNAIKFTDAGDVRVRVEVETSSLSPTLGIHVTDSGIGIPPEEQAVIYERYRQLDTNHGGTGLGLFITKHLVTLMGGTINLHSEVGKGTTFAIRLPLETPVKTTPEPCTDHLGAVSIHLMDTRTAGQLRRKLIAWGLSVDGASNQFSAHKTDISRSVAIFDQACFKRMLGSDLKETLNRYLGIIWVKTAPIPQELLEDLTVPVKTLLLPLRTAVIANACDSYFGRTHNLKLSQSEHSSLWPKLGLNIILAEENPTDRQLLQIFLQKLRCKSNVITNADKITSIPELHSYHAVLLSGTLLKTCTDLPGLPLIVCSEGDDISNDYLQYSEHVEGVLDKPVQPSQLIPLLEDFIMRKNLATTQTFSIH